MKSNIHADCFITLSISVICNAILKATLRISFLLLMLSTENMIAQRHDGEPSGDANRESDRDTQFGLCISGNYGMNIHPFTVSSLSFDSPSGFGFSIGPEFGIPLLPMFDLRIRLKYEGQLSGEKFERGLLMPLSSGIRTVQFEFEMTSQRKSVVWDLLIDYRLPGNLSAGLGISMIRQSYYSNSVTETIMEEGLTYVGGANYRTHSEELRKNRSEYALGALMEFRYHLSLSDRFTLLPVLGIRYPLSSNVQFEDEKQIVLHFGISSMFWI